MKCIILAGGFGDCLWPLSRKNYPKQFMNIHEGHSLLQDTIVRNMSFCDEFIIVTNEAYSNIMTAQLKPFQSLKYRVIYESLQGGTLAAVMLASILCNQSEILLVTVCDIVTDGEGYKDTVLQAKELARQGKIGNFVNKDTKEPSGMFICMNGIFSNAVKKVENDVYMICRQAARKLKTTNRYLHVPIRVMEQLTKVGIQHNLFSKIDFVVPVKMDFEWHDVDTVLDMCKVVPKDSSLRKNCIRYHCEDVCILNESNKKLIVSNDVCNLSIISTEDVTYVTANDAMEHIKDIMSDSGEQYQGYYDNGRISYRLWGTHEILNLSEHYKVKKVTIFPGRSMRTHKHVHRLEQWSVVKGTATITIDGVCKDYSRSDNVCVSMGTLHRVENRTDSDVVIIETGMGDILSETDIYSTSDIGSTSETFVQNKPVVPDIVPLLPAFKDNLWGGTKLRDVFGKQCDYEVIGESWELSAHPDGQSIVADGKYEGLYFGEFLDLIGKNVMGWKCDSLDRFPILIKFIDARQDLSIQIHPDDEYALENENEFGKNEMWYIVDCEPESYIYCGLSHSISKEEIRKRIENNTITDVLNKVLVQKGDCVMVQAGTIHAIGAGILICEIQQNSNCTYRMYDYDRKDKFGNSRELHVEKALDVVDVHTYTIEKQKEIQTIGDKGSTCRQLVSCKYFVCYQYCIVDKVQILVEESSFISVIIIDGTGELYIDGSDSRCGYKAGDSFFVTAGHKTVVIAGKCECIVTRV